MTIFDAKLHPRAPKGTFTDKLHTNPEVWLGKKPSKQVLDVIDYAEGIRSADVRIARAATAQLFAQTSSAVADSGRRRGLSSADIDDATSEALVSLNDYVRKGSSVGRGLIQMRAVTVTSAYVDGPVRHETKKGMRILSERVASRESTTGSLLSDREVDALAENVRETWPDPRHRPIPEFHRETERRVGIPAEHADMVEMEEMGMLASAGHDSGRAHLRDGVLDALDEKKRPKSPYEAYARGAGLPLPQPHTIHPRDADMFVGDYLGEIGQLASGYTYGENTQRENDALFAPFGVLSNSERDDIARAFDDQSDYADRLWCSAMLDATVTGRRRLSGFEATKKPARSFHGGLPS